MAREIELKFIARPGIWPLLTGLAWLKGTIQGKAKSRRLRSLYFDTSRHRLAKSAMMLRIRSDGYSRIQTIKAAGGSLIERGEWEAPIAGNRPDPAMFKDAGAEKVIKHRPLRRVFETRVLRKTVTLKAGGSEIELSLDRGAIIAPGRREPIHEIELELKKGHKSDLLKIGARLAKSLSLEYGLWAKAERGYALLARSKDEPQFAETLRFDPAMEASHAVEAICFSCLRQFAGNRSAILKQDSEGLHQARVGLRRLRLALSLLPNKRMNRAEARLDRELKWFIDQLTPARDFDVFLQEHLLPHCDADRANRGLQHLKRAGLRRRRQEFAGLSGLVEGERCRRLIVDAALWLAEEGNRRGSKHRSLRHVARQSLSHFDRGILKQLPGFERMNPRQLHRLRIRIKKLRYAVEFFKLLYPGKRSRKQVKRVTVALKALQDSLGGLNDIHVHRALMRQLLKDRDWRDTGEAFQLGTIHQEEEGLRSALLKKARRAAKIYVNASRFWR